MKIDSRDFQYVAVFAVMVTLVTSSIAYRTLSPPPSEQFLAMWVLGTKGLTEHYYPRDDPNLKMGEEVNWTLGIHNHMGSIQYVVVRVKLLNSTSPSPDDLTNKPSPVTPLLESTRVLLDNETWAIPFRWKITDVALKNEKLTLKEILINETPFRHELVTAVSGINYRFVFELWSYDQATNDLAFSWRTDNVQHSVWTQIWFNATTPIPE